ncbi:hypothetical protein BN946_scf184985.g9 [Trametes cinnabarina]|uniref:Uncharacterized protein n=1 Tax=Pycnoporus cinnabarinus TaxID=5643 RepID=A0A060SDZ1_PYCCI|nr:hypothetical protein BN946_scf184985.g9 [Trametes cinnabarina]
MSPITALTEYFTSPSGGFVTVHDGVVHNPLGAASYVYKKELAKPLLRTLGLIPPSAHLPSSCVSGTEDKDEDAASVVSAADSGVSLMGTTSSTTLFIHIGAQPNNSPHAGTIITFALAFYLGQLLQREYPKLRARALAIRPEDVALWVDDLRVVVKLDLVDTAPDSSRTEVHDGIFYQFSHRKTGTMNAYLQDYRQLIEELEREVEGEVTAEIGNQEDLMRMPAMRDAIRTIIRDRERIAAELAPERETLAMRSACPVDGCGMADKHGVKTEYVVESDVTVLKFYCPMHGPYTLTLEEPDQLARLELNTPLRNLARALVYMSDTEDSRVGGRAVPSRIHMRLTGMDYAGSYQEQLLHRQLFRLKYIAEPPLRDIIDFPIVFYAPLITDWSGAKLSKSLYVKAGAYEYLEQHGKTYLLEYKRMVKDGKDRKILFDMVRKWVERPAKLFRTYSIEYVHLHYEQGTQGDLKSRMKVGLTSPLVVGVFLGMALMYGLGVVQQVPCV